MGTFKIKNFNMTTIADYKIGCTATAKCASAGACCAGFNKVSGTAVVPLNPVICIPAGTAIATAMTIPIQTGITAGQLTDGTKGYPIVACAKATTGASTLAVSAVAAATAVYMM